MDGHFFDLVQEWPKLVPHLNDEQFKDKLEVYRWWHFNVNKDLPLIVERNSADEEYVWQKLTSTNITPYHYCVPHDCIELNSLIMGKLAQLYTKQPIYVLSVRPVDSWDRHIVASNKKLVQGNLITFNDQLLTSYSKNKVILFDLIYPLMPFFGYRWDDRKEQLTSLLVNSCQLLEDNWESMGYNKYYIK